MCKECGCGCDKTKGKAKKKKEYYAKKEETEN